MTGRLRRRLEGRRLAPAAVVAAGILMVAVGVAAATGHSGGRGVKAESLGVHYRQTEFARVTALPDGGLVAERDGEFWSYSAQGERLSVPPSPGYGPYSYVAPAAGGKSLVVDNSRELSRRNSDGSIDPGFGAMGKVELFTEADAVAELPSGKIILAGCETVPKGPAALALQMRNQDGSVDKSFGSEGVLVTDLSPANGSCVSEIAGTRDGGALVVGPGFLLELRADGTPDPGFGSAGAVTGLPELISARSLADGSIEAVGSTDANWSRGDLAVVGYSAAGAPDPLFGPHGVRRFDFGGNEEAHVASWAADGSVLVGGVSEVAGKCEKRRRCEETPIVAAFDPGGALEPGFAESGLLKLTALTEPRSGHGGVLALARRPDGTIVAAGTAAPKRTVAFMAAFSAHGTVLPDFGEDGLVRLREPVPASLGLAGMVALPDGDLLLSGDSNVDRNTGPVLARFAPDGRLVRSFGGGRGFVQVANNQAAGLVANASGKVLFGTYDYPRSRLVEMHAADGSPIASFGARGTVTMPDKVLVEALGIDGAGGVVVVAAQDDSEPGVVLRYRKDGRPARRFGDAGRADLRVHGRPVRPVAFGGFDRGRILVGGMTGSFPGRRFALTRLLPDGKPDPRFGSGGWSVPSAGGGARSLALARFGSRIYLAGVVRRGEERPRVVLLRFDRNGRLDRSFGNAGHRLGPRPRSAEVSAIVPTRKGVLVVLDSGRQPLLLFGRDGKLRRQRVAPQAPDVYGVHAAVTGTRLFLGWSVFSAESKGPVPYFSSRPLP